MLATQLTPGGRSARGEQVAEPPLALEHVHGDELLARRPSPRWWTCTSSAPGDAEQLARERAEDRVGVARAVGEQRQPADAREHRIARPRTTLRRYPYPITTSMRPI